MGAIELDRFRHRKREFQRGHPAPHPDIGNPFAKPLAHGGFVAPKQRGWHSGRRRNMPAGDLKSSPMKPDGVQLASTSAQ